MQEKLKEYRSKLLAFAQQLRDVRTVGLYAFLVVVLLLSWSGAKVIDTNYGLQRQIANLEQQNTVAELGNQNLKLQNDYYNTPQYLELTARANFGLAAPGETVLVVPKATAIAHTVQLPDAERQQATKTKGKQPAYQRNFQAWMNFFLHRQDATSQ
ncbi:MAG TPA: septum formation initiator family protein [Ktedonobacteraceae bacterium]|nr:septum formation initiator family protein [Ktedonobacteraceae bacterium]